jgi:hypothetical protein
VRITAKELLLHSPPAHDGWTTAARSECAQQSPHPRVDQGSTDQVTAGGSGPDEAFDLEDVNVGVVARLPCTVSDVGSDSGFCTVN